MISSGLWRGTKASRSSIPFWISARWAQAVVNPSASRATRRASLKSGRELKIATRRGAFDPGMSGVPFPAAPSQRATDPLVTSNLVRRYPNCLLDLSPMALSGRPADARGSASKPARHSQAGTVRSFGAHEGTREMRVNECGHSLRNPDHQRQDESDQALVLPSVVLALADTRATDVLNLPSSRPSSSVWLPSFASAQSTFAYGAAVRRRFTG